MNRKFIFFLLVVVLVLAVPATQARQDDTLRIGVLTDQSGALALYGFEQTQGFELGLDFATEGTLEVAGRPIEILVRDNASDIEQARNDARELVEQEGVEILVGTVSSTVTLGLIESAEQYDIILMAGPSATPAITGENFNENTFRVCRNSFQDANAVAAYGIETFGPNYIQLAPDNAFGTGSALAFDIAVAAFEGNPVQDTILVADDTADFTNALTEMQESGADFAYLTWAGASGQTLFEQVGTLGIRDTMGVLTGFNSNDVVELSYSVGDVGLMVYHYTLPDNDVNTWLTNNHIERYDGDVPDLFTECGFATAQAIVAALEETGGDTFPENMVPALEGLTFDGPKGEYFIRPEDHQALVPMYVVELVTFEPEEPFAFYELLQEVDRDTAAPPCLAPAERSSDELECLG